MLDPKLIRENPEKIKTMLEVRNVKFPLDELNIIRQGKKRTNHKN